MIKDFILDETGASVVEFVVAVHVLILIFFSMIAWGYSLTLMDTMYDAARKGARDMSVGVATEIEAVASTQARLNQWPQSFTIVAEDPSPTGSDLVRVTVTTNNFFWVMPS